MLSAIPLNEDKSYPEVYFARLPSIGLRNCVEFMKRESFAGDGERDPELDQVLQEQHNRNFKDAVGTKPFWRLIVLSHGSDPTRFTATWAFHHSLTDGTSALVFHRAFLSALETASSSSSEPPDSIVESPNKSLLPPLEELHPLPTSALFVIKALLGSIFPKYFNPRPAKLWTGGRISSDSAFLNSKVRSLVLSSTTVKRLLELSRKNKTTITGTLQCIIASATLSNLDTEKYERVKVDGPISLRQLMKWDGGNLDDEFVNGMTEYGYVHKRATTQSSSSFSWNEARSVRAAIQEELGKKGSNSVVGLLRYVSDIQKYFLEQVGNERTDTFEMSNIGLLKVKSEEGQENAGWKIGRCTFSQSPNVAGAAFAASTVTGGDGCAVIIFSWYEGIVEGEMMGRVIRDVEKEIEGVLSDSK